LPIAGSPPIPTGSSAAGLWPGASPGDPFHPPRPGTTVNNLLSILGVTKQSLNRVLRTLVEDGLVESAGGAPRDKRERHLHLTEEGAALERQAVGCQRARMRGAYRAAGPEAVRRVPDGAGGDDGSGHAPPQGA
jgi:DNA-binding transcriptional ArsR family regulator